MNSRDMEKIAAMNEEDHRKFRDRLVEILDSYDYEYSRLAKETGIRVTILRNYIEGTAPVTIKTLSKVYKYLKNRK